MVRFDSFYMLSLLRLINIGFKYGTHSEYRTLLYSNVRSGEFGLFHVEVSIFEEFYVRKQSLKSRPMQCLGNKRSKT